jgi:hypothetical protein
MPCLALRARFLGAGRPRFTLLTRSLLSWCLLAARAGTAAVPAAASSLAPAAASSALDPAAGRGRGIGWRQIRKVSTLPFDRLLDEFLDRGQRLLITGRHQGEGRSCAAGAARAADAVDVILRMVGNVVVEDVAHGRDVEAPRRHIARNQNGRLALAEAVQRRHAGVLVHVAVQSRRIEAVLLQGAVQDSDVALAVTEHDRVVEVFRSADEGSQGFPLLVRLAAGRDEALGDRRGRRGGARHLDLHGIVKEGISEALNLGRHGRREEQRLPGEGHELHDAFDIRDEAHVEHPVGLVDDEKLDAGEQQLAALEVIEEASRGRDQHVDPTGDLHILVAEGHAADEERDGKTMVDAVLDEALFYLGGQFTGRLEDEGTRHARPGAAGLQQRQHGQRESGCLARAGLCDTEHVFSGEHVRDGLRLDGRRLGVPGGLDGLEYLFT